MASQTSGTLSDSDLDSVSQEINRNQDEDLYLNLGSHLGFDKSYMVQKLKDSKDDKLAATLTILGNWRDSQADTTDARNDLAQTLHSMNCITASKMIGRRGEEEYTPSSHKYSHLVEEKDSSGRSRSITKRSIPVSSAGADENWSDIGSQSMVTSVTSSARSQFILVTKEMASSDIDSASSVKYDTSERTREWVHRPDEMRGAPGGDIPPDTASPDHTETLILRDYQTELAIPACEGINTIVVAPTGTGKTYIAVAVAQWVLKRFDGKRKILLVVNQVPLVVQQSMVFRKYIKNVAYVCGDHALTGTVRRPLGTLLQNNNVVVLTAQILVDALGNEEVSLSDIGLIIFDECHETKKKSPYNKIMEKYMTGKLVNKLNSMIAKKFRSTPHTDPLPQILGMTASLGVGGAITKKEAMRYMVRMCANLDVVRIATVQKHKESLAKVENKPTEETHIMPDREEDAFGDEIKGIMLNILTWIRDSPGSHVLSGPIDKLSTMTGSNHTSDNFSRSLCRLNRQISEGEWSLADQHRSLKTYVNHLKVYHNSLEIHETVRSKDALDYLRMHIDQERKKDPNLTEIDYKLLQLFDQKEGHLQRLSESLDSNNPGLDKLQHLLEVAFSCREEGQAAFRGILFTQTIASTEALKAWVMETPSLRDLNPEVLVGSKHPGMSLQHQTEILENFKKGVHLLLIATSVVEQGIDVPACNFVFRYNYISNAVGRIQARGRARTTGGRFELVVHQYRRLHEKDSRGKDQEELMKQATEELSKLSVTELRDKIEAVQQTRQKQQVYSEPKPIDKRGVHEFRCENCNTFVCRSSAIRVVTGGHHVVSDHEILERMSVKPSQRPREDVGRRVQRAGRDLRCAKCDAKLGSVMLCQHGALLAVSVGHFLVKKISQSKSKAYAKWALLPFTFKSARLDEVAVNRERVQIS